MYNRNDVVSSEVDVAILEHNLNSDKIMLYLLILHWLIAITVTSIQYGTYQLGFVVGGLITLSTLLAYAFYRGQKEFRIIIGIAFMLFSTLYIQQHLGRIEMHFHVFIAISFLTIYKDSYALISAAMTTIIYHIVFNYMQDNQIQLLGEPIYIFNYGCGYDIVLLHIFFVLFEALLIMYFINISRKRFIKLITTQKDYKDIADNLEKLVNDRTEELTRLNKIYNEAQLLTHLGNWEWDIAEGSLCWSDEIFRIFGLEPRSTLPTYEKFNSFIHPDDRTYVSDNIDLALRGIAPYHVVHRILTPQNELKHVRERGQVHYDEDGNPVRMLGTIQDITSEMNIQLELKKSEDKFKILTENNYMGVLVHDEEIYYVNPQLCKMSGFSAEELLEMDITELFVVEDIDRLQKTLRRREAGEKFTKQHDDVKMRCCDGSLKTVSVYAMTIEYEDRYVTLSNIIDVTDIRKAEDQIQTLSQIVEQTDDIIKMTDKDGLITYVNDAFVANSGYTRREVIGKRPSLLKSGKHERSLYKELWNNITQGKAYKVVLINRKKDGSLYHEEQTITPVLNKKKETIGYVSMGKDITERIKMEEKLSLLATTDKLTGINNRHRFEELFSAEIVRSVRYQKAMGIIMFDVDHFKAINDTYGHDVGDSVLKSISEIIQFNIRQSDIFARWGGEEFIILTPETTKKDVEHLAEKLRLALEQYSFETVGTVTASFGVTRNQDNETKEEILKRVDKAMYQAKENGRNRVVVL